MHGSILTFWYWKAAVNHSLLFAKVSVCKILFLPPCFFKVLSKKCSVSVELKSLSKKYYKSVCHQILWYYTMCRLDLKKEQETLALPADLEFLVVVSSVLYTESQIKILPSVWHYLAHTWATVCSLGLHSLRDAKELEGSQQKI